MKTALCLILSTAQLASGLCAQEAGGPVGMPDPGQEIRKDTVNHWTGGTALNVHQGRWELSLLTASRYGISPRLELQAHPLSFILLPQATLRVGWGTYRRFTLATEHGLFYPTLFMKAVSAEGTGGLISPQYEIPQMVALVNRFLVSYFPFRKSVLTLHAGIAFALRSAAPDPGTTIDLPVIYPRLAVFYNQPETDLGVDFRGYFMPLFGWILSMENFILFNTPQNYFMEHKGMLFYASKRQNFRLEAGYKLCYGKYPYGTQWHLLPAFDLSFGIR